MAEALRYIRTHAGEDIRAFHVANVIPYSKRWLEQKFTEELGHGIFEEIRLTLSDGTTPVADWDPDQLVLEEFLFDAVGENTPSPAPPVLPEPTKEPLQAE